MTQSQFATLCTQRTIDPSIALENDDVIQAIKSGDIELLTSILDTQF